MIQLINVTKYYKTTVGKKYILKNVNLTIPSYVNVGILGKNGSGKSTFLKMLAGIDFPTFGKIVSDKSFSWVMGLAKGLLPSMTGKQNVKFVCRIYGKTEEEMKEIVNFVKKFSEIEDYFEMPIELYSNGMKSRLTFALSLAFDFDYFIIDEILSVGDAGFKVKSKNELKKKIQTANILMVSHSMDIMREFCDVGIIIDKGTVHYFDNIEDAIAMYNSLNKLKNKKILCNDGNRFSSLEGAAKHYKVRPKSIQQALEQNNGTHIFLNKIFYYENTECPKYQIWEDLNDDIFISSDGMIFRSTKEAYYFYKERIKHITITEKSIANALQKSDSLKKQNLEFHYLKEYILKSKGQSNEY